MFVYQDALFDKPVYVVQAWRQEELAGAFEQMEKLRHSGFLAGYFRRAALYPEEHALPEILDVPLLRFILFRARTRFSQSTPARVFCPDLVPARGEHPGLALLTPAGSGANAWELATSCDGRGIFAMLREKEGGAGYYKDAFEELLCFADAPALCCSCTKGQEEKPVRELLRQVLGHDRALAMGCFARDGACFHAAEVLLQRLRDDTDFLCHVAGAGSDAGDVLRHLCLPKDVRISTVTRLEQGEVFLLQEELGRLVLLCQRRGIDTDALCRVQASLQPGTPLPLPGVLSEAGLNPAVCWTQLPEDWERMLAGQGHDIRQLLALSIRVDARGELSLSAKPVGKRHASLGCCRQALDERNDLLSLDLAGALPCEAAADDMVNSGAWHDALTVNRFGVVCGCTRSDLLFRQGNRLLTPPAGSGLRDGVLRRLLLERKVAEERAVSLARVLSSQELYCLDSVRGMCQVTLADPASVV